MKGKGIIMSDAKQYEFTDAMIQNLMVFLDRVEIKGFKELAAINEVLNAINHPVVEKAENKKPIK